MKLFAYPVMANPPAIVPARSDRGWMDRTHQQYAYRCLPLSIANAHGWEALSPCNITAEWNGGPALTDITVAMSGGTEARVLSHFGHGVLTFDVGFLFRTEPNLNLWVGGPCNEPKDGIYPLTGIVESDWMPFTFTMNWIFTRPGPVFFRKDEPFCFFFPIQRGLVDTTEPEIHPLAADPELQEQYDRWRVSRESFNTGLRDRDPATVEAKWQKDYFRGKLPTGVTGLAEHQTKLRPKPFADKQSAPPALIKP